jgi:nucleotidyltransferase substrate binding protein (TIGR01987 family)
MEDLDYKRTNFAKTCAALKKAIITKEQILQDVSLKENLAEDLVSAGVIKHFELAYETCWKYLKLYLSEIHKVETSSPKSVFQTCFVMKIFSQKLVEELSDLSDIRNQTTHIYDHRMSQRICAQIITYCEVFDQVLQATKE